MREDELRKSKRYVKTLTFIEAHKTDKATHYTFIDDDGNYWTHDQISVKDAMDYGGLKAASKAAKFFKAMKNKKQGDKVKCACVIRELQKEVFNIDENPVFRNVEEIL